MQTLFKIFFTLLLLYIIAVMIHPDFVPAIIPETEWNYEVAGWLILGRDKVGHFFLMGFAAFAMNFLLKAKTFKVRNYSFLVGSILVAIIVTFEELRQVPLPDRNFEIFDIFYNFAGVFIIGRIGAWFYRIQNNNYSRSKT